MTLPPLNPGEFTEFFTAVHDVEPFPWQLRLAERVFTVGWPAALDVPTGAGKTAALDVAVFHLALEADRSTDRRAPVRTCLVVDRRIVVDAAWERGRALAARLSDPGSSDVLRRVASRLSRLAENPARPLSVVRLRGGVPQDPDWIRTPTQPAVITSTVDQVGSRLLFRGYGVSDTMKSLHAGLLGADTLFLLDEAHLSQPFVETLGALRQYQRGIGTPEGDISLRIDVVTLSATQDVRADALLADDDQTHPILGPRLAASKPVELILEKGLDDDDAVATALAERAWALGVAGGGDAIVTAVICNRVARARRAFDWLSHRSLEAGLGPDSVILLTGRSRPLARASVLDAFLPRITAQRARHTDVPLFAVATQTIEAGADLDFDALVTELAPLDALRQRFGRLNRMGRPVHAKGVILADARLLSARADPDPLYGTALPATWQLLAKHAEREGKGKRARSKIDFGVNASRAWVPDGEELAAALAPRENAPILLPCFVDAWVATTPRPDSDPDPALFLHGTRAAPADVAIVWRADLAPSEPTEWVGRVAVCPPSSLEALPIPIGEARRWLDKQARGDVTDLEAGGDEPESIATHGEARVALRWRGTGDEATRLVGPAEIAPGDVLVVPADYGGCDKWGWAPKDREPVADLGTEANEVHRGRQILRLSPLLLSLELQRAGVPDEIVQERTARLSTLVEALAQDRRADILGALAEASFAPAWNDWIANGAARIIADSNGLVLALERRVPAAEEGGEASTEGPAARAGQRAVELAPHLEGVGSRARGYAEALGLSREMVHDVWLGGRLHDLGKAHEDIKLWLYGGDEIACAAGDCLAKSGRTTLTRSEDLPKGARHEVASLALCPTSPDFATANDPDLVRWLVGTHHGWGRPFFPPVSWPPPRPIAVVVSGTRYDSGVVPDLPTLTADWLDLACRLHHRYGPWRLAQLESIVRLADHRQSEQEQQ